MAWCLCYCFGGKSSFTPQHPLEMKLLKTSSPSQARTKNTFEVHVKITKKPLFAEHGKVSIFAGLLQPHDVLDFIYEEVPELMKQHMVYFKCKIVIMNTASLTRRV